VGYIYFTVSQGRAAVHPVKMPWGDSRDVDDGACLPERREATANPGAAGGDVGSRCEGNAERAGPRTAGRREGRSRLSRPGKEFRARRGDPHVTRPRSGAGCQYLRLAGERLTPAALSAVVKHMCAEMGSALRLAELAEVAGMSRFRLARAFRRTTGMSPHQYLIHLRIRRAVDLMASRELSLGQVAAIVGFTDQSHMTNVFRRVLGITPARYRKALRRRRPDGSTRTTVDLLRGRSGSSGKQRPRGKILQYSSTRKL